MKFSSKCKKSQVINIQSEAINNMCYCQWHSVNALMLNIVPSLGSVIYGRDNEVQENISTKHDQVSKCCELLMGEGNLLSTYRVLRIPTGAMFYYQMQWVLN